MRLSRPAPAPPPPLSCAAVRTEHAQLCRSRRSPRPYPLISRVPAGVDVLYNRSFGLLPLTLLDEGRKEREERGEDKSYWPLSKAIAANLSSRIRIGSERHCEHRHPVDFAME